MPPMKTVYTIRLPEEYAGMLEHIKLSLAERGITEKDHIIVRTVLLTGIRAINQMITQGKNIFEDHERNEETDD